MRKIRREAGVGEREREDTGVGEREGERIQAWEKEREPPKKRGMVGERKIGRETGGGRERERQPLRGRTRDMGESKINRET